MRILHVVPTYVPAWRYGGPIKSVHGLCKGLASLGHDVHVFTTNVDGPGNLDVPIGIPVDVEGVKVRYFASNHLRRLYWSPGMGHALKQEVATFDLVHLHSVFLWPTAAAASLARRHGVPYVHAPRGMLVPDLIRRKSRAVKTVWIRLVERRNLAAAAAVHFTSRLELEAAAQMGFIFRSICLIPNAVEEEETVYLTDTVAESGEGLPERFLLFIGRVNWKKGLDRLLAALALVPDCELVIVGNNEEGYRERLEALAGKLGIHKRVLFLGPVYGVRKVALLRRARALVLPSYSENFGNVVLEAMAAGCPVIVTPEVGAADIVKETRSGVVLDGTPEALAAGIAGLLDDPAALKEMGDRGRRAVLARYTWSAVARDMERVYRDVLHAHRLGAGAPAA